MNKTKIEWVKNPDGTQGYTWNPITGCLNGCEYCYARKLANTRLRKRYQMNDNVALPEAAVRTPGAGYLTEPFYPRFWEDRLSQPFNDKYISQKGIFVCDMADLFGIGIPHEWTKAVMDVIEDCPTDRFYLLTKQPQNLQKFSPFPDNCWVGVSATGFQMSARALYVGLERIEAKVKFLSYEPLLEDLNIFPEDLINTGVRWVIIGSQTKPYKPPKMEWIIEIIDACDKVGIPVFLKNNLEQLLEEAKFTGNHNLFWLDGYYTDITHPEVDLHLRQEFPIRRSIR